ncbi:MAG: hypothetical protein NDF55_00605 [archaeon GB-1867-005]|nr:hypothetical protein [Candidatus Culexmicrobium cathedralense]
MGGILFIGAGSGGERILSIAYGTFKNLRSPENYFVALNTSRKDHERVKSYFEERRISSYPNFIFETIGQAVLSGYGAGKDPKLGLKAYETDREQVVNMLKKLHKKHNFKIAIPIASLGGGCGTMILGEIANDIREELSLRVIPLCTVPFRREGDLLIENAILGLKNLLSKGLSPLIFDNELMMRFSQTVGEGVDRANIIITSLISSLVDLVEFGGFANPPIDIIDLTRLILPQCGFFTVVYLDNYRDFKKKWKDFFEYHKSLISRPIDGTNAFVMFKARSFPHEMAEKVLSYLRVKYKAKEIIPSTLEDRSFGGYTIVAMVWGMSIKDMKPRLKTKRPLSEEILKALRLS